MIKYRLQRFKKSITVIIILVTGLVGCGYTTRSLVAIKYKTINVAPFVNKMNITSETQEYRNYRKYYLLLESTITQELIRRFIFDGNLKVSSAKDADLLLEGELIDYNRNAIRSTENDEVEEYRATIKVNLTLKDQKQDKILWKEDGFTGETTYLTQGTLAKSEDTAIGSAISDLVRRIVERTIEEW
ncbi:MAG: LptE family protein [Candidatus Omnitrophota bacterium]